ncbi:MFS transporter [Thiomonas sp.]
MRGAWVGFAIPIGLLPGFGSVLLVKSLMTPQQFTARGWRIFFAGFLVAIVGIVIRSRTMDSFVFERLKADSATLKSPAYQVWREMPLRILRTSLVNAMSGGAFFLSFVSRSFFLASIAEIIGFGFVFGFGYGAIPTFYTENFPTRYRASGASAAYQLPDIPGLRRRADPHRRRRPAARLRHPSGLYRHRPVRDGLRAASEKTRTAAPPALTRMMWGAIGACAEDAERVHFTGAGSLPSAFAVTDFAAAAVATAGLAVAEWLALAHRPAATVEVDRRLSSIWFATTLRPIGWTGPWAGRRGFDSLVQMSSGIAETDRRWQNATIPTPSAAGTRPRHGLFDGGRGDSRLDTPARAGRGDTRASIPCA